MVKVGEIQSKSFGKIKVKELIYMLKKMEQERDVVVHVRHEGIGCFWTRDLMMVFQNDGEDTVALCVDIMEKEVGDD